MRHASQPGSPLTLIPRISPTALNRPIETSIPSWPYANGFWGFAVEGGENVARDVGALADRMLGRRRHRAARLGIDDRRAVADGPDVLDAGKGERGVGRWPAAPVPGGRDAGDHGVRRVADRAHDCRRRDRGAVVELDAIDVDPFDPATEPQIDPRRSQLPRGISTEPVAELREDRRLAVHENDPGLEADVAKAAPGELDEVLQLGRDLDARRSAADDDERQQLLPARGVGLDPRLLEHVESPVAQVERVTERSDPDGVLGHPGDRAKVRHTADGEDQRVVLDRADGAAHPPPERDCLPVDVDRLDISDLDLRVAGASAAAGPRREWSRSCPR